MFCNTEQAFKEGRAMHSTCLKESCDDFFSEISAVVGNSDDVLSRQTSIKPLV